jgi:hypothetical protein
MLSAHLTTSMAKPPPRSKLATRYGGARYGTPRYGWSHPAPERPGTRGF